MKPLLRFLFLCSVLLMANSNKAPRRLYVAADESEDGMPTLPAPVDGRGLSVQISVLSDKMTRNYANNAGNALFRASFSITAAPVNA
ncbi:hypothetical protein PsyrCH409_25745 [Pseudomonas viridiflava]|uniref:Uncharacterized protein n=1 Tax=Pseudomonas viridiflava TaxID=33069 RepID=A0AA46W0Q5_PSEVI|nr:hypothetical protein PsyrCH409_25745 [Pseudomonas viridiflava]TKJ63628.1 hypothetical protein PviCFBP13507_14935 [Pseudomonas viridiflava]TKK26570.1 hypothetical protein PviCFBP13515_14355 [Pseudomonas viridiflava]UZA71613.1 hypothetical protein EZZ81_26650 [Pseudomonas viridiflava]